MSSDSQVLTVPIDFPTEIDAAQFMRRYASLFTAPSMRNGKRVYAVLLKKDYEGVMCLASEYSGRTCYGVPE